MPIPAHGRRAMARNGAPADADGHHAVPRTVSDRSDADGEPHPLRPTAWTGALLVLASAAISLVGGGVLPEQIRIRWTVGTYYGPEFAPALLVMAAFPLFVAGLFVGLRALARVFERAEELEVGRPLYEGIVLLVLLTVVLGQVGIVVGNLL